MLVRILWPLINGVADNAADLCQLTMYVQVHVHTGIKIFLLHSYKYVAIK